MSSSIMAHSDLQIHRNHITDQSLNRTRRMVDMLRISHHIGLKTLVMVDEQGEQLDNVESSLDKINENMKIAENNLDKIKHGRFLHGLFQFRSRKNKSWDKAISKTEEKSQIDTSVKTHIPDSRVNAKISGQYITRISNDSHEDEMEKNMEETSKILETLKQLALGLGQEVDLQNHQAKRMQEKSKIAQDRISVSTNTADKHCNRR